MTAEATADARACGPPDDGVPHTGVLAGFRIGVTSDRRSEDLIQALERRGAQVLHAPALKIVPVREDLPLIADTQAILAARPEIAVVTTAYGMRRWCEAADAAGLGEELMAALARSRIFVRGPKARGAVRAAGLDDAGSSHDERTATLVDMVLAEGVAGRSVAVQLHGYTDTVQLDRLRAAGARVHTVTPYRWAKPGGTDRLGRLIEAACTRNLDALTFTSAPAVDALWSAAEEMGLYAELIRALSADVLAAAVGPVTAAPLLEAGITPIIPERFRMGALIRLVCDHLPGHRVRQFGTRLGTVAVRGNSVALDGGPAVDLSPTAMALFRGLAEAGGAVVPREELLRCLPAAPGGHALEMAISRLRQALPDGRLVATVIKRGYRLNV